MAELKCSDGTVVQISKETEAELRVAFEPKPPKPPELPKPKFGDIVTYKRGLYNRKHLRRRIVLYSKDGTLRTFHHPGFGWDAYGDQTPLSDYTPTGENIFKSDLLNLDT